MIHPPEIELSSRCFLQRLGRCPYRETLDLQRRLARARMAGTVPDLLLLAEHPPVVTLGRASRPEHLLASPEALRARGIGCFEVDRGGDVTYHGPGQIVGYPILDLRGFGKDVTRYLRNLERAICLAVKAMGLDPEVIPGKTGVWVGGRKIASIGVHVARWVTWHGFALNVCTDLQAFDLIVPCGLHGVRMTSLSAELEREVALNEAETAVVAAFGEAFGVAVIPWPWPWPWPWPRDAAEAACFEPRVAQAPAPPGLPAGPFR
jgi:lipoate-protein ligase B